VTGQQQAVLIIPAGAIVYLDNSTNTGNQTLLTITAVNSSVYETLVNANQVDCVSALIAFTLPSSVSSVFKHPLTLATLVDLEDADNLANRVFAWALLMNPSRNGCAWTTKFKSQMGQW
jgi:hypothetical protein